MALASRGVSGHWAMPVLKTKIFRQMLGLALLGAIVLGVFIPSLVLATTFTETYKSDKPVGVGTVVSLSSSQTSTIENTTPANDTGVIGVVASDDSSIIDLQSKNTNLKIALDGDAQILVTDLAGNIKTGDYLIISPLSGIAMKDGQGFPATRYIGVAQQEFSSTSSGVKQVSATESNGNKKTVNVGLIKANIFITARPPQKSTRARSFLTTIGEKIVGKPVSTIRVVTSAIILLSTLIVSGLMLNASVRGTFVSLGRNPLARSSLVANLMKIILVSLIIFETGLVSAYLVLSL